MEYPRKTHSVPALERGLLILEHLAQSRRGIGNGREEEKHEIHREFVSGSCVSNYKYFINTRIFDICLMYYSRLKYTTKYAKLFVSSWGIKLAASLVRQVEILVRG